ncbi:MAG: superoxide dismutase [Ni] [Pirellulaceae bacterium]
MSNKMLTGSVLMAATLFCNIAIPHCEVPCGIYGDQRRFESMLEDTETISKACAQIVELSSKEDALSHNQLARWVATKEAHATSIQTTIAQYFMTQRLKPDADGYTKKLTSAHAVMVAAMKAKQGVDAELGMKLEKSIKAFYEAYEGKKAK